MNSHDPIKTTPVKWRAAFDAFLSERMSVPFQWGSQDCCLFAASAAQIITGVDVASDVRGIYSCARGARLTLERIGGIEAAGARFGPECRPMAARVGDVGLLNEGDRSMLGVCVGESWLVTATQGLSALPLDAARKAWRAYA